MSVPRALVRAGRPLFLLAAVGLGAWAIIDRRRELGDAFSRLSWGWVLGAFVIVLVAGVASMLVWRELLAGLGSRISLGVASRVVFLGQLGKYLPGSVWAVVGQTELAREHHVPRKSALVTSIVGIMVAVLCGLLVAAVFLPLSSRGAIAQYWWALATIPIFVVCLAPPVLNALVNRTLRLFRRAPLEPSFDYRCLLRAAGWQTLVWLLAGLQGYLLMAGMGAGSTRSLGVAIGGFALAFAAGVVFIPAPAGAGVREAVLVAALAPVLPVAPALAVALLSRVLFTASDLSLALAAVVRTHARAARNRAPT